MPPIITDDGLEVTIGYTDTCINNTFMGTVNFTCVVVGGRTPVTIEWLVDGEVFTNDSHSVIISVSETASLLVIGIDNGATVEQDLNYYMCRATNRDGSVTAFSQLSRCGEMVILLANLYSIHVQLDECYKSIMTHATVNQKNFNIENFCLLKF